MWLIVAVASVVVSGVWLVLLFEQNRVRTDGLELILAPLLEYADDPQHVCVVLPVCNAATALRRCVDMLLDQDHPSLSILIVDDRSEDETKEVALELARDHVGVTTIRIDELPEDWLGKSHALWRGSQQTDADWLLFVDDDCLLHPAAVRTALTEAKRRRADLLSLWPRHDGRSFWEHLLIPLCGGIIALWFAKSQGRGDGGFANGQFLLITREAYRRIDGHRSVKSALIEDVAIAERARRTGLVSFVGSGRALFSVRMYDGFRAVFDGWSRIFIGAIHSPFKLLVSMLWLVCGSLLPYVALPALLMIALRQGSLQDLELAALALSLQHLILQITVSYRFWGMGGCDRRYLWFYPLSVTLVIVMLLWAMYVLILRRRVRWRTTTYAIDGRANIVAAE